MQCNLFADQSAINRRSFRQAVGGNRPTPGEGIPETVWWIVRPQSHIACNLLATYLWPWFPEVADGLWRPQLGTITTWYQGNFACRMWNISITKMIVERSFLSQGCRERVGDWSATCLRSVIMVPDNPRTVFISFKRSSTSRHSVTNQSPTLFELPLNNCCLSSTSHQYRCDL